jgi:hypothetical protein
LGYSMLFIPDTESLPEKAAAMMQS